MKTLSLILFGTLLLLYLPKEVTAQLGGSGNLYWQEVWVNLPPVGDPGHPNHWMVGNRTYTDLAYDKFNDVVYIVNPGICKLGNVTYKCPRIFAWNAETGTPATHIVHTASGTQPGQLYVDQAIVNRSFSGGQYALYKIDLDDEGRIFAANVVAPLGDICYPGPPPDCDPDYLAQGAYKVYRWDSYNHSPRLVFASAGSGMTTKIWGTAFDVVGKRTTVGNITYDSTRIFTSGGKFYSGLPNDQVNILVKDSRPGATIDFRLGVVLQHNEEGSGIAAHGIAATGHHTVSQLYMDSNFREVVLNNQNQNETDPFPQTYFMSLNQAIPGSVSGSSGAMKYYLDEKYDRPYLIVADGLPTGNFPTDINENTRARVIDLSSDPLENWPPMSTPQIGTGRLNNLTGSDNWISGIDYKVWINPANGDPHLQVFVLMSNNGIASYRTRERLPIPVELSTFRGLVNDNRVDLSWQIESETNNHGFEVYRSFNKGHDWEQIGFVKGKGTTNSTFEYSYADPISTTHETVGTVQYRLRQVDTDGKYMWTPSIDVYIGTEPTNVTLYQNYPNPFNPSTSISYQLQQPGFVTLKVYNSIGEEISVLVKEYKDSGMHIVNFDATHLATGTYMYQLNADGIITQKKMVLMK